MDITTYPNKHCEKSSNKAHYFIHIGNSIWLCKYCHIPKWMPATWIEAEEYSSRISQLGVKKAYAHFVTHHGNIRKMLEKLAEDPQSFTMSTGVESQLELSPGTQRMRLGGSRWYAPKGSDM